MKLKATVCRERTVLLDALYKFSVTTKSNKRKMGGLMSAAVLSKTLIESGLIMASIALGPEGSPEGTDCYRPFNARGVSTALANSNLHRRPMKTAP